MPAKLTQLILIFVATADGFSQGPPLGTPDYTRTSGFVDSALLPLELPTVLWKVTTTKSVRQTRGPGFSNPVVADGVVFLGDEWGRVYALSALDGSELWRHEHGTRLIATPSVDKERVYFGSSAGITAIRRDNGVQIWQHAINHGAVESTPIPVEDRLYASGNDGFSYALRSATGAVIWMHDLMDDAPPDQPGFSAKDARVRDTIARPRGAACDGDIFVQSVFDQSRVVALDCKTGARRWTFQAAAWTGSEPTIFKEQVLVNSRDEHLYCLNRVSGRLLWMHRAPGAAASRPAVHAGKVFQPCNEGQLLELDAVNGKLLNVFTQPDKADRKGMVYSFPILSKDTAYFATGEGQLFAIEIGTAKLRWKLRPSKDSEMFTDPATDGSRIFVTTRPTAPGLGEAALYAIGL